MQIHTQISAWGCLPIQWKFRNIEHKYDNKLHLIFVIGYAVILAVP